MEDWLLYIEFMEAGKVDFPIFLQVPHCLGKNVKAAIAACVDEGLTAVFGKYVAAWRIRQVDRGRLPHNDCYVIYARNADGTSPFHLFVQVPKSSVSMRLVASMVAGGLHHYIGRAKVTARKRSETNAGAYSGLLIKVA